MSKLPPAPYPDGTPDYWASAILPQGERGPGSLSQHSNGDYVFHSGAWHTIHGLATVVRSDGGCPENPGRSSSGRPACSLPPLQRVEASVRRWSLMVIGDVKFEREEVFFADPDIQRFSIGPEPSDFAQAMVAQPGFMEQIRDDSFASTLNDHLRAMGVDLCTLDGSVIWRTRSSEEISDTIAWLRGLGEDGATDFGHRGLLPNPPRTPGSIIAKALSRCRLAI